jgi:mannose-1-phosphate guanylyltransferase
MYVVILAGGGGTRLWPLSRPEWPKPFLPLLGDESLLQATVSRIAPLVGRDDIYCVTDRRFGHLVRDQAPNVRLIVEPNGRNTAPAIALATAVIDRPDDEVMVVLPADAWITKEDVFRGVISDAHDELAQGAFDIDAPLVTLGVQLERAATEYGYLIPDLDRRQSQRLTSYVLKAFEEKPSAGRAAQLLNEPGAAWNAGMFLWQRGAIRAAIEKYTPLMMLIEPAAASELAIAAAYERINPISIDHAVMEGAAADHRVVMGSMDVGWSDLGSWTSLLTSLSGGDSRGATGRVVQRGESIDIGLDDLLLHTVDGRLAVETRAEGTIVLDGVAAHLVGARHLESEVRALLDRVAQQEARA